MTFPFTKEQFQQARAGINDQSSMEDGIKWFQLNVELIEAALEIAAGKL